MIVRTYNPIERGQPAVWIGPIERGMTPLVLRYAREAVREDGLDIVFDSSGGSCAEGLRLHTALAAIPARKRVTIINASSMASVVAMLGDEIRIVPHGRLFLHPPGYQREIIAEAVAGHMTSSDMRSMADRLDATDEHHLDIFERRTGLARDKLRKLNADSTVLNAENAVRLGFADEVVTWRA